MCGIVGYVGNKDINSVILVGLEKLEYRGYDSAGFASVLEGKLFVRKKVGRINELSKLLNGVPIPSKIGIGHTRWATHGKPTEENAHPHVDCKKIFAVVHNGIIENFRDLKRKLEKKHKFFSNTDTEVIPHLLEEYYKGDFFESVLKTVNKLEGSFALAIINVFHPNILIGVKRGSPLIVGVGKNENIIASDIPAILSHTRKVISMDDNEIAVLSEKTVEFYDFTGKRKKRKYVLVEWEEDMVEKRGYPHFMLKEIHEQPRIIEDNLMRVLDENERIKVLQSEAKDILSKAEHVIIQAAGTSFHAGLYGKSLFQKFLKTFTECELSSEFRYREPISGRKTVCIGISQSGETADTLAGIRKAKELGIPIISLVNVKNSTIDRESDYTVYLNAGPEIGVASTKAYTSQLFHLLLISIEVGILKGFLTEKESKEIIDNLKKIPDKMRFVLGREEEISQIAKKYYNVKNMMFLGRGLLYPTALEGALKLKEISYIHATGYAAGEMKHGPIALLDREFPVIAIAPKNELYEKMVSNIEEVKAREAPVISVGTIGDNYLKELSEDFVPIPDAIYLLQPLISIIPLQLFAYHVALLRGCDVDKPRNLAKSVTVE
ncbi:MAG: glutamine--fructose-6-phosphate transaminase (isomerizing) [Candidatus Hydrothermales bacterium]